MSGLKKPTARACLRTSSTQPTYLARRVFGRASLEREVSRVLDHMHQIGYQPSARHNHTLPGAIARLLLMTGCCELESITLDLLEASWKQAPVRSSLRRAYFRLTHVLNSMGLVLDRLRWASYTGSDTVDLSPTWLAWCRRWHGTSTLAPRTREAAYHHLLRMGRWLAREHPSVDSPSQWTRELAASYVAAVDRFTVGQFTGRNVAHELPLAAPLGPNTKASLLRSVSVFFRDCQEWGWMPRRFDPRRAFSVPRSIKALIGPSPRVISDDIWAKLLWAGLNLEEGDLPVGRAGPIPGPAGRSTRCYWSSRWRSRGCSPGCEAMSS
jgi:hypothetical protein